MTILEALESGSKSVSELSRMILCSKKTIVRQLKLLEEKGLVVVRWSKGKIETVAALIKPRQPRQATWTDDRFTFTSTVASEFDIILPDYVITPNLDNLDTKCLGWELQPGQPGQTLSTLYFENWQNSGLQSEKICDTRARARLIYKRSFKYVFKRMQENFHAEKRKERNMVKKYVPDEPAFNSDISADAEISEVHSSSLSADGKKEIPLIADNAVKGKVFTRPIPGVVSGEQIVWRGGENTGAKAEKNDLSLSFQRGTLEFALITYVAQATSKKKVADNPSNRKALALLSEAVESKDGKRTLYGSPNQAWVLQKAAIEKAIDSRLIEMLNTQKGSRNSLRQVVNALISMLRYTQKWFDIPTESFWKESGDSQKPTPVIATKKAEVPEFWEMAQEILREKQNNDNGI